jgi:hypothetical protein
MSRHILPLALLLATTLSCGTDSNESQTTTLIGVAIDYDPTAMLSGAGVTLLDPPGSSTTSDANGHFSFTQLTRGTSVRVMVSATNYRETVNPIRLLGASTIQMVALAASVAFVNQQYAAVAVTPTAGTAMLIAKLEDDLGTPRTAIPLSDITLLDQNQAPVGTGPYVFGASGNLDNTLTATASFGGQSRIAFLNVPPGNYTLRVVDGVPLLRPLAARADGVTLVVR